MSHANGASKLIQHRGTKRFSTQFESALLASQFPMVVSIKIKPLCCPLLIDFGVDYAQHVSNVSAVFKFSLLDVDS